MIGDSEQIIKKKIQSSTAYAGAIKIHPLPMISIDGEGLIVDSEQLQEDLPDESRGGHRIAEGVDFSLYKVGDPSDILCERCGEIIDIIIPESKFDDVGPSSATTVNVTPPPGATIQLNQDIWFYFDEPVMEVTVNGGSTATSAVFGSKVAFSWRISPALVEDLLVLNIEWTNRNGTTGSQTVGPYIVNAPDAIAPLIIRGTVADGKTGVNSGMLNAGGFQFDFDEQVTGSIKLTDEAGADLDWFGSVVGRTATLVPTLGKDTVKGTTYKINIDVRDPSGNRTRKTITFVTEIK